MQPYDEWNAPCINCVTFTCTLKTGIQYLPEYFMHTSSPLHLRSQQVNSTNPLEMKKSELYLLVWESVSVIPKQI